MELYIIILIVCSPWVSFNNLTGLAASRALDTTVKSFHIDYNVKNMANNIVMTLYGDVWLLEALPGLPWWLSGKASTCQCRRRGFHQLIQEDPTCHRQLSPCAATIESVLWSLGATTIELTCHNC